MRVEDDGTPSRSSTPANCKFGTISTCDRVRDYG
jgi:hypothetical protein